MSERYRKDYTIFLFDPIFDEISQWASSWPSLPPSHLQVVELAECDAEVEVVAVLGVRGVDVGGVLGQRVGQRAPQLPQLEGHRLWWQREGGGRERGGTAEIRPDLALACTCSPQNPARHCKGRFV